MLERNLHRLFTAIGLLTGQHLVEHDPEAVDVTAGIRGAPGDQLGGKVGDRTHQLSAGRRVRARCPREAEVPDHDAAVFCQQDVLGLDVAMDDAGTVGRGKTREDGIHDRDRLRHRQSLLFAK